MNKLTGHRTVLVYNKYINIRYGIILYYAAVHYGITLMFSYCSSTLYEWRHSICTRTASTVQAKDISYILCHAASVLV